MGEAAARGTGRENLNRLQHVALIMLNQAEFGKFEHFNGILLRNARRDGDGRYQTIAKINTLRSFFDRGDGSTQAEHAVRFGALIAAACQAETSILGIVEKTPTFGNPPASP